MGTFKTYVKVFMDLVIFVLLLLGFELQSYGCSDIGSFAICHWLGLEHPYPLFAVLTDVDIIDILLLM